MGVKIKTYLKPPPSGVMGPLSMGNWGYNSYKWSYFTRFITIVTGRTLYDFAEISFGTPFAHLVGGFNPFEKY